MFSRITIIVAFILFSSIPVIGQQYLHGKTFRFDTYEILISATIYNTSSQLYNSSDLGGNYKIAAKAGDTIIFSFTGYISDTLTVTDSMLQKGHDVYLSLRGSQLKEVVVGSSYKRDSIKRHEEYSHIYEKRSMGKMTGGNTPTGFGISLSPLTYLSKKEKQVRQLRKRLEKQEEEYYIDYRFSKAAVTRTTGLRGDSLILFMNTYRPTYQFCRQASNEDMLLYINDKLKLFKQLGKKN